MLVMVPLLAATSPAAPANAAPHVDEIVIRWRGEVPEHRPTSLTTLGARRPLAAASLELVEIPGGQSAPVAAARIARDPRVLDAEPNHPIELLREPDLDRQWGLHNTGQEIGGVEGVADVDLDGPESWTITRGRPDTVVAVADTGVDIGHPDLQPNVWTNKSEASGLPDIDDDGNGYIDDIHGWDFYNNDASVYDSPEDFHGTHVAGIVAAAENGSGTIGVAPGVTIMPLKFLGSHGGSLADALDAIEYASDHGADILNASWGTTHDSSMLRDALSDSGMLVVAAAGNEGQNLDTTSDPRYPAAYDLPNLISVAAVDHRGELAWFSNYGPGTVELGAPGHPVWSTAPEGGHDWASGTSMAAPHVAGAAALLHGFVDLSPSQLVERLTATVEPLGSLRQTTASGGMVAAAASLGHAPMPAGATPLTGDWDGDGVDETGFRHGRTVVVRGANGLTDSYGWGHPDDVPVTGDWDGDGVDTLGLYRDGDFFFFSNELLNPTTVGSFHYGRAGDLPVSGDWDGDGRDTLGIVRPNDGQWHLRNRLAGGRADRSFSYGRVGGGDLPLVDDWDGDGVTGVGVIRGDRWLLRDAPRGGPATLAFGYGRTSRGDLPISGDWGSDGSIGPGVVRSGIWYLRDQLSGGAGNIVLSWSAS